MRGIFSATLAAILLSAAFGAAAFDIKGGPEWQKRNGFGMGAGFSGIQCMRDFCEDTMETRFGGSIGGYIGGVYRFMPNLSMYFDFTAGLINTDLEARDLGGDDVDKDRGLFMAMIVGAAFHVPITGWLDAHMGFGLGYVYTGFWAEVEPGGNANERDWYFSFKGLDFQLRTGAHVYLFSNAPTFGFGPYMRFDFPLWFTACYDIEDVDDHCDWPEDLDDDLGPGWDVDDSPFIFQLGLELVYGF